MKPEFIELAKYRLEKSKRTLDDAKLFFESASLESTINRIYYASFYAVNALLITHGLASAKHSGVRSLFNREFVKTGTVKKEFGKFYSEISDIRQEGDYKDFVTFEKNDVSQWLKNAENFINALTDIVNGFISDSKNL